MLTLADVPLKRAAKPVPGQEKRAPLAVFSTRPSQRKPGSSIGAAPPCPPAPEAPPADVPEAPPDDPPAAPPAAASPRAAAGPRASAAAARAGSATSGASARCARTCRNRRPRLLPPAAAWPPEPPELPAAPLAAAVPAGIDPHPNKNPIALEITTQDREFMGDIIPLSGTTLGGRSQAKKLRPLRASSSPGRRPRAASSPAAAPKAASTRGSARPHQSSRTKAADP